ncbi:MAG: SDR family oxidoreductase [Phycisphaerae bacterium]|nr:SDR family oxidoreductase [Phycisphaerae bacterium]
MAEKLADRRVLVTGGAAGIGRATVLELAERQAVIGIHYCRSDGPARELKEELSGRKIKAEIFQADLTKPDEAGKLVKEFAGWAGGIDCLINNAGDIVGRKVMDEMDREFFRYVMELNVDSAAMVTRAALPYLRQSAKQGGASVVNMSSLAGRTGAGLGSIAYSTSKGAVITMTRGMARELGPEGIRVNAVAPGLVLGTHFHSAHTPKPMQEKIIDGIPLKQAGRPEDIARAIVFLASEYDGFINGAILDINGGAW